MGRARVDLDRRAHLSCPRSSDLDWRAHSSCPRSHLPPVPIWIGTAEPTVRPAPHPLPHTHAGSRYTPSRYRVISIHTVAYAMSQPKHIALSSSFCRRDRPRRPAGSHVCRPKARTRCSHRSHTSHMSHPIARMSRSSSLSMSLSLSLSRLRLRRPLLSRRLARSLSLRLSPSLPLSLPPSLVLSPFSPSSPHRSNMSLSTCLKVPGISLPGPSSIKLFKGGPVGFSFRCLRRGRALVTRESFGFFALAKVKHKASARCHREEGTLPFLV